MKKNKPKRNQGLHHFKILTLLISKIVFAFIFFSIGFYVGGIFPDTRLAIMVAFVIALLLYVLSVMRVIKWLKM